MVFLATMSKTKTMNIYGLGYGCQEMEKNKKLT